MSKSARAVPAFVILFSLWAATSRAAIPVDSIWPPAQTITAAPNTHIVVDFGIPLDSQSVADATVHVFGRWSGPMTGAHQLENGGSRLRFVPDTDFSAGEWVMVFLPRSIRSTGGDSLVAGYAWNFWTATGTGVLDQPEIDRFSLRLTGEGHIQSYGAYAGDLNNDGFSDLAIPNEISHDVRVCLNDGTGGYAGFTVYPLPAGVSPSPSEGADFNGNGQIDLAVGNAGNDKLSILLGNGLGGFSSETAYTAGQGVRGVGVLDLNTDGAADIATAHRFGNDLALFVNNGNGTFAPGVHLEAGGSGETACAVADANADGIMDLFVGTHNSNELILLLGDGNGGLTFATKVSAGGRCWMIAPGDIDSDGDVDVVSANSLSNNFGVILGDGAGGLTPAVAYPAGDFPLAIDLGDLDGDGDLDLVTSNFTSNEFRVFENAGDGTFINPRSYPASAAGSCAILHDRDNDGDLDITGIDELDDLVFLFDNACPIPLTGDANESGDLTAADVVALVDFVFKGGPPPPPCEAAGDVDCSGTVDAADLIGLVNHVFKSGPEPCLVCVCP